jgi:hypothetical protein
LTKDDLFLFTLEDLDTRLQLHRGEYDALTLAWLLRKLLLKPLRDKIAAEVWPDHFPERARGSRRVRDPRHYGWPLGTEETRLS